jgi:PAS domain S-box-containing protein
VDEAAATSETHAGRAGEHARTADTAAQRVAAAIEAVERRAQQAEQAAAAAAEAAAVARRSADEAGIDAEAARQAMERTDAQDPVQPLEAAGNGVHRPLFERPGDATPVREPRPGFDDAGHPMAMIGLDGHFRQLNRAFTDLVGYPESEFAAATWPPVMDRANLPKHREQMEQMLAGAIDSAEVNTGYVHAQGLLVPVAGTLKLVKEGEEPDHFLLEVAA